MLTVGSTALKLGMHPATRDFRARVQTLVDDPRIERTDVQSLQRSDQFLHAQPGRRHGAEATYQGCCDRTVVPVDTHRPY